MRRKKVNMQKPLFVIDKKEDTKEQTPVKTTHRGRPKKNKSTTDTTQTKSKKKTGQKSILTTETENVTVVKAEKGWKDFNKTKPELMQPCEFYVEGKNGKKYEFRGYIKEPGCTVTNEPYYLVVLRKRYGNLFYKEIKGCTDVRLCPQEFPECKNCKRKK